MNEQNIENFDALSIYQDIINPGASFPDCELEDL